MRRVCIQDLLQAVLATCCLLVPALSFSEHPIDVERLSAAGSHYEALLAFQRIPDRQMNADARLAAARSAWALSLPDMAIEQIDRALENKRLGKAKRAQALVTRSIIELQEGRTRVAPLYAEKAIRLFDKPSPLRARAWMVWGESLLELGTYSTARQKFEKALREADGELKPDLHYRIGMCAVKLGELGNAEGHFEQVPLSHPRAAQSIRQLASIALERKQYDKAQFWFHKARAEYHEDFLDSWVDFGLYRTNMALGNQKAAYEGVEFAEKKFPPSDDWLTLTLAEVEVSEWRAALRRTSSHTTGQEEAKAARSTQKSASSQESSKDKL